MMHFLITGHTGFKGSWLSMYLTRLGHQVSGLSLNPEEGGLFSRVRSDGLFNLDLRGDIRDVETVNEAINTIQPDFIVHLAAQPLVRVGYKQPHLTFETNVNGTLNILRAASAANSVKGQLIVTTDKVYRDHAQQRAFRESDPLGGRDPYSASKAMADIATQAWVASVRSPRTAIARAGNVIGGGDISSGRLMPAILRITPQDPVLELRYPNATRPWQHILDCLTGYLQLIDHALNSEECESGQAWNFGPIGSDRMTVSQFAEQSLQLLDGEFTWRETESPQPAETSQLELDSTKAMSRLGWQPLIATQEAIRLTIDWHQRVNSGQSPVHVSINQIDDYLDRLSDLGLSLLGSR